MQKIKNIFQFLKIEKVKNNLKSSFQKFPISFISAILTFWIVEFLIISQNYISDFNENLLMKWVLSLVLVYFLWIWIKLFLQDKMWICSIKEAKSCEVKKKIISILPIIFWIIFFFNFEENLFQNFYFEEFLYVFVTWIFAISFLFISKFLKIKKTETVNWVWKMIDWEYKNENYFYFLMKCLKFDYLFLLDCP